MSSHPWKKEEKRWNAKRCAEFAEWLNEMAEFDTLRPYARPAPDLEGRPGLLVEWHYCGSSVELYFAWSGETTLLRRAGAPVQQLAIGDRNREVLGSLREALRWLEGRDSRAE